MDIGNWKFQKGFTILEVMISIVITAVIGVILVEVMSKGFRGSTKTQLISVIKQNGQVTLNLIDQTLRLSDKVVCIGPTTGASANQTIVISRGGKNIRFRIYPEAAVSPTTNGYIAQDFPDLVNTPGLDALNPELMCDDTPSSLAYYQQVTKTVITNSDLTTGVSVKAGNFNKFTTPGFKDAVTIYFDLGPSIKAKSTFEEQVGETGVVTFQSTVQLR